MRITNCSFVIVGVYVGKSSFGTSACVRMRLVFHWFSAGTLLRKCNCITSVVCMDILSSLRPLNCLFICYFSSNVDAIF